MLKLEFNHYGEDAPACQMSSLKVIQRSFNSKVIAWTEDKTYTVDKLLYRNNMAPFDWAHVNSDGHTVTADAIKTLDIFNSTIVSN